MCVCSVCVRVCVCVCTRVQVNIHAQVNYKRSTVRYPMHLYSDHITSLVFLINNITLYFTTKLTLERNALVVVTSSPQPMLLSSRLFINYITTILMQYMYMFRRCTKIEHTCARHGVKVATVLYIHKAIIIMTVLKHMYGTVPCCHSDRGICLYRSSFKEEFTNRLHYRRTQYLLVCISYIYNHHTNTLSA